MYIKNEKQNKTRLTENTCRNIKTLQKCLFCKFISNLRKTVNDSVLVEGQMKPLSSKNNFVQYVNVTEVHLGIPEHLLISVSWTNEKEVVFLLLFFLNNKHKILCKEKSTLALNP